MCLCVCCFKYFTQNYVRISSETFRCRTNKLMTVIPWQLAFNSFKYLTFCVTCCAIKSGIRNTHYYVYQTQMKNESVRNKISENAISWTGNIWRWARFWCSAFINFQIMFIWIDALNHSSVTNVAVMTPRDNCVGEHEQCPTTRLAYEFWMISAICYRNKSHG